MEREIREQPVLLAANWRKYRETLRSLFRGVDLDLVLLAARGSSDHAALYARYLLEIHLGIPVVLAAPSVVTRYGVRLRYPERTLAVGISQSGAAPDVAEVLEEMRNGGHTTLAITNTSGSRLTDVAEHSLLLDAGPEQSVAATKTYTTSLLALYALGCAFDPSLPDPELPSDNWLDEAENAAQAASGAVLRNPTLFSLARGYRFCSAHESALKLMECAMLPCKAYSTADFEHGPKVLADHGSAVVCFGSAPPGLAEQGGELILAPEHGGVQEEVLPIWDGLFGQWLALLAARARGLDPDHPSGLSKVTKTL